MPKENYCKCKERNSVYPDSVDEGGYGYFCSDCDKAIKGRHHFEKPELN